MFILVKDKFLDTQILTRYCGSMIRNMIFLIILVVSLLPFFMIAMLGGSYTIFLLNYLVTELSDKWLAIGAFIIGPIYIYIYIYMYMRFMPFKRREGWFSYNNKQVKYISLSILVMYVAVFLLASNINPRFANTAGTWVTFSLQLLGVLLIIWLFSLKTFSSQSKDH